MELYRFEALVNQKTVYIVVAGPSEEKAFQLAEREIEKDFLKLPLVEDLTLLEKKKIGNGGAFVLGS